MLIYLNNWKLTAFAVFVCIHRIWGLQNIELFYLKDITVVLREKHISEKECDWKSIIVWGWWWWTYISENWYGVKRFYYCNSAHKVQWQTKIIHIKSRCGKDASCKHPKFHSFLFKLNVCSIVSMQKPTDPPKAMASASLDRASIWEDNIKTVASAACLCAKSTSSTVKPSHLCTLANWLAVDNLLLVAHTNTTQALHKQMHQLNWPSQHPSAVTPSIQIAGVLLPCHQVLHMKMSWESVLKS